MRRRELSPKRFVKVTEELLVSSGVPPKYWRAQLSKVKDDAPHKAMIAKYLQDLHEHVSGATGLMFYGGFETGKTSLAVIILKETIQRGGIAHFISSKNIPSAYFENAELETLYGSPVVIKDRIRRSNLIVIDDLGAEPFDQKGPAGAQIESVLRDAYEYRQTVIATTNVQDPKELEAKFTQGVVSLLGRTTTQVEVQTSQWRKKK